MQGLAEPTAERVAWGLVVATALISLAGLVLTVIAWSDLATQDAYPTLAGTVAAVVYAALGALIIRRAGNRIGWLLLGEIITLSMLAGAALVLVALVLVMKH